MVCKEFPSESPGTCEYVTLCGKRDFADVIKDSDGEIILWASVITGVLIRGRQEEQSQRRCEDGSRSGSDGGGA